MKNTELEYELHGVMAEFDTVDDILRASKSAYSAGYRKIDAYSPFPIHGLDEAIGFTKSAMSRVVLIGAIVGLIGGFTLQYYTSVIDYPLNIGGRPLNSLPAWVPIMFECTVLGGALSAVVGMLLLNGLPLPYHPVFNVPAFKLASKDHFYLVIETKDPKFDREGVKSFLQSLGPKGVYEVPC